jgi:hypothetical protein
LSRTNLPNHYHPLKNAGHKEDEMDQGHERGQQNAREPLPHGNDDWRGPFTAGECDVHGEGQHDGAAVFDASGQPFVLVDPDTCVEGKPGALARAGRVASILNREQHLYERTLPPQAEVPMTDTPLVSPRLQQLLDDTLCTGTAGALAQSLQVMGERLGGYGYEGWAVISRRAEQFVRAMHMQVTRFLQQPDCHLRHPTLDFDLLAAHVDVADVGRVMVHCTDVDGGGWHPFPLEDLNPAGPVDDAVRSMVGTMVQAFVLEHIDQAKARGDLPGPLAYIAEGHELDANARLVVGVDAARPGGDQTAEVVASRDPDGSMTVHHLQVHDEYVMGEDGPHAEAVKLCRYCDGRGIYTGVDVVTKQEVELACQYCNETGVAQPEAVGFDAPEGDEAFGENGS